MKVIALLSDAFGGKGGIAEFNRNFFKAAGTCRPEVAVIALPRLIEQSCGELPPNFSYRIDAARGKLAFSRQVLSVAAGAVQCDAVLCMHLHLLPFACFLSLFKRVPIVLMLYGIEAWSPRHRGLIRFLTGKPSVVVAISRYTLSKFKQLAAAPGEPAWRCVVLPCSIDLDRFSPGDKDAALVRRYGLEGKKVLLTIARLSPLERYKGIDEVLESLPRLLASEPALCYVVAGEGGDRLRLERKAAELALTDHVRFTGFVPEAEKVEHYRLADVFVMPSRAEGFGIVYLEALACGVPVVAGNSDAASETLGGGKLGILVDPQHLEQIVSGIERALQAPHRIARAELEHFSFSQFESRVHSLFDSLRR